MAPDRFCCVFQATRQTLDPCAVRSESFRSARAKGSRAFRGRQPRTADFSETNCVGGNEMRQFLPTCLALIGRGHGSCSCRFYEHSDGCEHDVRSIHRRQAPNISELNRLELNRLELNRLELRIQPSEQAEHSSWWHRKLSSRVPV